MDQLGNTERITEEQDGEEQQPEEHAGGAETPCPSVTLAVYRAEPDVDPGRSFFPASSKRAAAEPSTAEPTAATAASGRESRSAAGAPSSPNPSASTADGIPASAEDLGDTGRCPAAEGPGVDGGTASAYPDGFTGTLALQNLEAFDEQTVGEALGRVAHLISWAQAQQARLMDRMEEVFRDRFFDASGPVEPGIAFSLAAAECATILNVPQTTAQRMMYEAGSLCSTHASTMVSLEEGLLSYAHAQVVLEQCENLPAAALPEFEASLLKAAEGQTRAQFSAKARRLREKQYPETIAKRHLTAFEQRKVTLDREEDGMSCLSAHLRAEEAQQIYTTLTTATRGEQAGGDSRTADQLRADILAQLLMGGLGRMRVSGSAGGAAGPGPLLVAGDGAGGIIGRGPTRAPSDGGASDGGAKRASGSTGTEGPNCDDMGAVPRAEIMVLINAETLFGANEQPAELHGYGPISAEAARRLARNAAGWTGLAQDPHTGEILGVGRRRKVPAGLRRWLRARDGTCRFPGCRVSTASSDIDHTVDWSRGGPTDHGNLEHLCRRHHRFKTLGYWKACQPTPGVIEWTSPTGRVYRTEPFLELGPVKQGASVGSPSPPTPEAVPPF
ncbi:MULTISPECIES: HNH endonuclease signature motif containing protein [unclassified Arthrobacter]|uniref:HNH endonuclease n=1 Tax=unclassified Arthrobacter TaxID=235627 RepID=UPI001E62C75F|nr:MULTISPECIES: HNH endonuclease signature motif containing protein [unclassified Arthrobacter]MCC9146533.1 HNH endonuclease [Arthrobacter sp. zg-Y919]MDK1277763.1 DUF222 domain-containing protein [Arthrobacter sp. zg.Y919]WIB02282.1 DUF222 domain-containing protein [Arthrobacter sp. zg-Y919]